MTSGYGVCPTCGCRVGAWQGGQQMIGPVCCGVPGYGGPGWMPSPGWETAPGWNYGAGAYAPAYRHGYGQGAPAYPPSYYGGLPTDSEIEEMIYDAIDSDPLIPFDANIDVSVEAGTVSLRGEVLSKRIKHAAGDDAWWQPGVIDVHNEIKVASRKRPQQQAAEKPHHDI